jgi:hypothetical protein
MSEAVAGTQPDGDDLEAVPQETTDIDSLGRVPSTLTEVELRPPRGGGVMRVHLARYAMVLTAAIALFGALGAVARNQDMIRYAESSLDALWRILGLVYVSFYAEAARIPTALRRWLVRGRLR